jgi:3-polyprenyl-4-hydroxybenzoate decarboxylase
LIQVYPIPSEQGQITMQWTGASGTIAQLRIYDVLGKTILETELRAKQWLNTQHIDLSAQATGIYILKMQIGAHQFSKQLMIK